MKKFIFVLIICVFSFIFPTIAAEPDVNFHIKCLYPTVRINVNNGMGSGTVVYSSKINNEYYNVALTCAHVVGTKRDCEILTTKYKNWSEFDNSEKHHGRVYYIDHDCDMAFVLFKTSEAFPVATIKFNEHLFIGNQVSSVGFGDTLPVGRLNKGEITAVALNDLMCKPVYRLNTATYTGDSGSGVWYDYKLVAIRFAVLLKRDKVLDNDALAVPIEYLLDMSKDCDNGLDFIWDKNLDNNYEFEALFLDIPVLKEQTPIVNGNVPPPEYPTSPPMMPDYYVPPPAPI